MRYCNDWSEACGSKCSIYLLDRGRIKQAIVSRQKQEYQRQGRDVNSSRQESGSQAQVQSIRAVRGQTQKSESEEWGNAQKCQPGQEQDFAKSRRKSRAYVVCGCVCDWVMVIVRW